MAFTIKEETRALAHQLEFVDRLMERKVLGCFDEMGVGKTLSIILAVCKTCVEGDKALIIMPPFLANNWHTEIEKFSNMVVGVDVDLVPYTMLGKRVSSFEGYKFIAADEAHYLKNLDAQRTQKFHGYMIEHTPPYFVYATGTPIMNRIPEIYSMLLMFSYFEHVSPRISVLYNSYYKFCMRFCNVSEKKFGGRSVMQFTGMKHLEELKEYLKPWTIRRKASEVLELPDMDNQMITANYKDDPDLAMAWSQFTGDDGGKDIVAKKNSAIAKAHFTAEYVHSALESGNGPVVVFSDHRDPVSNIHRELSEKWRVASIMGGDSMAARTSLVDKFQKGELDVIVATVGSASVGITLTRSNLIVFNDIPWVPASLDQARKRIHRISQDRSSRCVYIVGSKIDSQIIQTIKAKMKVINQVLETKETP